ncbi:hypothetical protein I4F81_010628 [Pyropia yezoensis]|uniref:Uncharacterized protein n=1 Tax=Pyropia yezoensis TaxID=2788 RepID=A0ACC3CDG9_PYRYE|nr:hypothetical protein I4F81_010628 [Neopyropia yezoensis]
MSASKRLRTGEPGTVAAAVGDAAHAGAGDGSQRQQGPAPQVPVPLALPGGPESASSADADEPEVGALPLEVVLARLAPLQQRRLYWSVDVAGRAGLDAMAEREQLKLEIGELSRRARELLPSLLWPLFHHKALLYRSVKTRVEVLRRLLDSNPARETLRSDALDHEQVRQAVRALYDSRDERRGFGSVVGFPGMGKTYLMRLLLDSQAAPAPAAPEDAEATFAEMMSWWMSLPVFVISFNGITTASSEDLELAGWSDKLPSLVRILYSEMMRAPDDSDFAAFCDAVLENLHDGKLTTSNVSVLVKYVFRTRCRAVESKLVFNGVLLADELVQLSRVPPPSPSRRRRLGRGLSGFVQLPPPSSSSSSSLHGVDGSSLLDAHDAPPASAPGASVPTAGGPESNSVGSASVMHGAQVAEVARSRLCTLARHHALRLCVSSLSEGFVKRELTASGSTPVPVGVLQLVEATRVADAVRAVLSHRRKGFQVTSKAGLASVLSAESVGVCLGVLAGGHPRAAEVLISAIEKSRDGEPFLGSFLSRLMPERLSLAASSVDVLCQHPLVVAVGLLGYEADPLTPLGGDMLWDHVYAQGALTRGVLDRAHGRVTRSAFCAGVSATPIYSTRLNVAFLLEVVKRKASLPRIGAAPGGWSPGAAVVDEDLYASLQDVCTTLETGHAPIAWERFVFSGLTAVSQARRICSQKLDTLVRDGREHPPLHLATLLDLFPASPPYVSSVAWLEAAHVDASRAFVGVRPFGCYRTLLDKTEEELLSFVWQAGKTNFSAVDGVVFFKCTGSEVQPGPRHGELVVVFLQVKDKANLNMEKDVIRSAASAIESFASAADGPSWTSRSVFVVLSRRELTLQRSEDLPAAGPPILVVDEPGLQATFGPGLHALIRSSAIAFGTQVIDLTRARFSVGDA